MADTEWSKTSDASTTWTLDSEHRAMGWGDTWGYFPWGEHNLYSDFTEKVTDPTTTWTKL